jgi:hypothetical protein
MAAMTIMDLVLRQRSRGGELITAPNNAAPLPNGEPAAKRAKVA